MNEVFNNIKIGNFVRGQRILFEQNKLSKDKIDMLNQTFHDWSWDVIEDQWLESLKLLKEYYSKFKTSRIPNYTIYKKHNLGNWVSTQRVQFKNNKLSKVKY